MYEVKNPEIVFDPYMYMPSYGESEIEVICKGNFLELSIFFDDEKTSKENCLKINFKNTVFHKLESFPGVKGMCLEYKYGDVFSSLIKFSESEYKTAWEDYFKGLFKLSHYKIFFLNANKSVEIICEDFQVENFLK